MTHTLRLLCKFSRADDAVYPSSLVSLKAACFGLSVPSKLVVVLFSGYSGFFPQGKKQTPTVTLAWPIRVHWVYGSETHIIPHYFFWEFFDRTFVSVCGGPLPGFGSWASKYIVLYMLYTWYNNNNDGWQLFDWTSSCLPCLNLGYYVRPWTNTNRGSYMSAHVLLNLLNELGKRDKMRGLPSILSLFRNEFNKFNCSRRRLIEPG